VLIAKLEIGFTCCISFCHRRSYTSYGYLQYIYICIYTTLWAFMLVLINGLFPLGCSYDHGYTHCAASDRSKLMETWN
jgi:hypothetical protein